MLYSAKMLLQFLSFRE